jgi:hypothetical protein
MAITDEQAAALRTMLAGKFEEHYRISDHLDEVNGWGEYPTLVQAAFFEAVNRVFRQGHTDAQIVQFVADARARFDPSGSEIDPSAAERLVRVALGEGSIEDLDDQTVVRTETVLLGALVTVKNLDDATLDRFMKEVRDLADEWIVSE